MSTENEFGFTNSTADVVDVLAWVQDAIADGWDAEPTYGKSESMLRAVTLKREGWTAQALVRCNTQGTRLKYCTKVSVWAPDKLAVHHSTAYNWDQLRAASRRCQYCKATDVDTARMNFAGRACKACRKNPEVVAKNEPRGWCD